MLYPAWLKPKITRAAMARQIAPMYLRSLSPSRLKAHQSMASKARWEKTTAEQRAAQASKAGKASRASLTAEERSEAGRNAAKAYWARLTPKQRGRRMAMVRKARESK